MQMSVGACLSVGLAPCLKPGILFRSVLIPENRAYLSVSPSFCASRFMKKAPAAAVPAEAAITTHQK